MTMKFSMLSFDWIGFDLDHTLVRYRLVELQQLIYASMCEYLCETHQYNPRLMQTPYDHSFAVKGLIYDSLHGNLIQLNSRGFVHTALHGVRKPLSREMIESLYPEALESIEDDPTQRFRCIFTYFDHSIGYLLANLVDLSDEQSVDVPDRYSSFLVHLNGGFVYLFDDFHRGNYFASVRENPSKYIYPRLDIRQWLEELRRRNKRLFLATNSRFDYTDLLSSFALGDDWKDLFDLILVDCKKPAFFARADQPTRRPFHRLSNEPVSIEQMFDVFPQDRLYAFGNSADLHALMTKITDKDPRVIYFGDHIKSDINALKLNTDWFAAVVIEELEFDLPPQMDQTFRYHSSRRRTEHSYQVGHPSKYFSSFFASADDLLSSSYWYTYITEHAHLSLSCLSVLANDFDFDHQFEHELQTKHFLLLNVTDEKQE